MDRDTLSIGYEQTYRLKKDKVTGRPEPIILHKYNEIVNRCGARAAPNDSHKRTLYPLCTVETYLEAMKASRCSYLFLNPNNLAIKLNANQASSLVVDLVRAGDPGTQFNVRHIRSFSSSLAWLRGASFETLMSSCHWSSTRSFIHTYFKSDFYVDPRLNALNTGPLVS